MFEEKVIFCFSTLHWHLLSQHLQYLTLWQMFNHFFSFREARSTTQNCLQPASSNRVLHATRTEVQSVDMGCTLIYTNVFSILFCGFMHIEAYLLLGTDFVLLSILQINTGVHTRQSLPRSPAVRRSRQGATEAPFSPTSTLPQSKTLVSLS